MVASAAGPMVVVSVAGPLVVVRLLLGQWWLYLLLGH